MKKIIMQMYVVITAIALIHGTCITAAQEQYQSTLLREEMASLGDYIALEVTTYLRDNTQSARVIASLENITTSDDAVKFAVSTIITAIKNNDTFMATQMLGALLKDLNAAYNTNFKTDDIIRNIANPTPVSPISSASETNISSKKPDQNIQIWISRIWENIQYYMNRAYEAGKNLIAGQKTTF
ncbi:MAG TPA: hypothetical protein VJJ26_00420 [Candidatus Babeliales bacterium]|nr:hypothetical protein [Candidatus Babeliales bacterium]